MGLILKKNALKCKCAASYSLWSLALNLNPTGGEILISIALLQRVLGNLKPKHSKNTICLWQFSLGELKVFPESR